METVKIRFEEGKKVFIIPENMNGKKFQEWKDSHQKEIKETEALAKSEAERHKQLVDDIKDDVIIGFTNVIVQTANDFKKNLKFNVQDGRFIYEIPAEVQEKLKVVK